MADFAKKLTVSFGAFSCTLSGFDDPFPVMSQVVDYFQKLSKTDPSFGAHPERPDTEALRALAEKTSGLSVGAELHGDEVVLSSVPDEVEPEFVKPEVAVAPIAPVEEPLNLGAQQVVEPADPAPFVEEKAPTAQAPAEDIDQIVSQAFEDCQETEELEAPAPEALPQETEEAPSPLPLIADESPAIDPAPEEGDAYAHLQLDDLDDEMLANLNAEELYETIAPIESIAPNTAEIEPQNTYVSEAVTFDDVEDFDAEDLLVDTPEDAMATVEQSEAVDPVPVWAAELISDEPIETVTENSVTPRAEIQPETATEEDHLSYDEHIEAEQNALARILAASQDTPETAHVEKEAETDADAATARSLVLGFGAAASLDATHAVETSTIDARTPTPASDALAAMGVYAEEDDDFTWDTQESAMPAETPSAAPLLLTPTQQIAPIEDSPKTIQEPTPSPAINMNQPDPRAELRRFANAAGAVSLTDLLEASAAYSTLVNGRPSFSRGEVLDLLDEFSGEEGFSQEARIKTFGSLLRGGRINRVNNGQYEMSGDALSEYAQARKAG